MHGSMRSDPESATSGTVERCKWSFDYQLRDSAVVVSWISAGEVEDEAVDAVFCGELDVVQPRCIREGTGYFAKLGEVISGCDDKEVG